MPMKNITEITLPALADGNPEGVATRSFEITQTSDGASVFKVDVKPTDPQTVVAKLVQGVEIKLSLKDIDEAGNASLPRELVITPTDVTPPSEPGSFALKVSGEVNEP